MLFRLFFCLSLLFLPVSAFAEEQIHRFTVEAEISANRLFQVKETIDYDFGEDDRHGIFRFIPDQFIVDGQKWSTGLRFLKAEREELLTPYRLTTQGVFKEIRIGDPDSTVTGRQSYTILYEAHRVVRDFAEHQELYWNVTGNDWEIPIHEASFVLKGPKPTRADCRTGLVGSDRASCTVLIGQDGVVRIKTEEGLRAHEGLTIALKYPLGTFLPRPWEEVFIERLRRHAWWLTPIGIGFVMLTLWFFLGRDPKGRGLVIPEYEPPKGHNPLEVGAILDETILPRAVTGAIMNLARLGYLVVVFPDKERVTMSGKEQQIIFRKQEKKQLGLSSAEREIYQGLFQGGRTEVTVEELKKDFYSYYRAATEAAYESLMHRGLISRHPTLTRGLWLFFALGIGAILVLVWFFSEQPLWLLSAAMAFFVVLLFGYQMPRVTKEGAIAREHVKGLKYFLSVTEKERLAFFDAPERTPEQFSECLPYAIALGVEKQWAKQFAGIELQPAYLVSTAALAWTPIMIDQAMDEVTRLSSYASFYQPPQTKSSAFSDDSGSSSSGGSSSFSGGGFGGGGGGSW